MNVMHGNRSGLQRSVTPESQRQPTIMNANSTDPYGKIENLILKFNEDMFQKCVVFVLQRMGKSTSATNEHLLHLCRNVEDDQYFGVMSSVLWGERGKDQYFSGKPPTSILCTNFTVLV